MLMFFLFLGAIIYFITCFKKKEEGNILDSSLCNCTKGFLMIMIVFSHTFAQFDYTGIFRLPIDAIRGFVGQVVVAPFFLFSGYGLYLGYINKENYNKKVFIHNFLKIYLQSFLMLIPLALFDYFSEGPKPLLFYLKATIGLEQFSNFGWFLFAILFCYLLCIIINLFKFKNKNVDLILITIATIVYVVIFKYIVHSPANRYNSIVCFPIGVFFAIYKNQIEKILDNIKIRRLGLVISTTIYLIITVFSLANGYVEDLDIYRSIVFSFIFLIISKTSTINNKVLSYIGKYTWFIFMMHRLAIVLVAKIPMNLNLFYIAAIFSSGLISYVCILINKLFKKLKLTL